MFGKKSQPEPGKSLARELTEANQQLVDQASQLDALTGQVETLTTERDSAQAELAQVKTDLAARDLEVSGLEADAAKAAADLATARTERDEARAALVQAEKKLSLQEFGHLSPGAEKPLTEGGEGNDDPDALDGVLADFAALDDPKERADFYAKNEAAITKAVRDRKRAGK